VSAPTKEFPVVGIGASAGGLAAFESFFSGMPANTPLDMAFVLVQHLAPDHKSLLAELIGRYTTMKVFEVEDGMVVQPNCAYIIPPAHDMAFVNGTLHLLEPAAPRGQRLAIDFFFRSLAQDQHERAIGIVLSGTGCDGTLGIRAIKGEGGMVMVQSPATCQYEGMPRSALATGLVDFELAPAQMGAQLQAYAARAIPPRARPDSHPEPGTESALNKIFILLRVQTGHDFSMYKPSTIHRRIERRLALQQILTLDGYLKYLQTNPAEVEALFRDLLIGVTSFFRDPEAFKEVEEKVIPALFAGKAPGASIRVWSAGCSTGEEAYSLAILLKEHQETLRQNFNLQVFATDLDARAIATARAGLYPASIANDLTPERLARFFVAEPDQVTFRIHKGIRDLLVFSEQDLIKDPPFSRMDFISCRNLLIYLGGDLQKKVIALFHYALNPGGVLFLGTSETVGEYGDLFTVQDRKLKLFQRGDSLNDLRRLPPIKRVPTAPATAATLALDQPLPPVAGRLPLRDLTERALLRYLAAAATLVNERGEILYIHGRTGTYLEPAPGEAGSSNLLKMAREGLRRALTAALHKAAAEKTTVRCPGLRVKTDHHFTALDLTICPVNAGGAQGGQVPLFLVVFEEPRQPVAACLAAPKDDPEPAPGLDDQIAYLRQELRAKEEYLQATNEELETSVEELKSTNEEMQSVNEELQSTNEELETSKEELQSVNEELATVNAELQTKVADLSRANNDMNNLLAGTGIGTVFVDLQLRVLRFTPAANRIINLIAADTGRPMGHIVSNLVGCGDLVADVQTVLDTLVPVQREVQTTDGRWYAMRLQPYRTLTNVIEGAVLTFVDITEVVQTREALRRAQALLDSTRKARRQPGKRKPSATT
jgi:two-component system CheB/CheR fusion protein